MDLKQSLVDARKLQIQRSDVLGFSAKESIGEDELWRALVHACEAV